VSNDAIIVADFTKIDYAFALLGMPPGIISFERGLEEQLLRLAVHEVVAAQRMASEEDKASSLQALLCWVLYAGMRMQRNHSQAQAQVC